MVLSTDPQAWAFLLELFTYNDDSDNAWLWRWRMAERLWGDR